MFRRRSSRGSLRGLARLVAAVALGGALPLLAPALGAALGGCSADSGPTTSGRRVTLATRVELSPGGERFTTGLGWSVTLTRAYVSTGVLRYFDGASPIAHRASPRASGALAARFLGLTLAHAHPGHYHAGNVLGEMLVPASVDLLAGTSALADGEGVSGWYRSARFTLSPPAAGALASELGTHVAVAEGSAEKSGHEKRWFRAVAKLGDVTDSAPGGEVDGCVFEATAVESDGTVTVRVSPSEWFTLVDFGAIDAGVEGAPSELPAGSQPRIAFAQGVAALAAYRFTFTPGLPRP